MRSAINPASMGYGKAAIPRLAKRGSSTEKQIAAVTGYRTLGEVERYAAADQVQLVHDAMGK